MALKSLKELAGKKPAPADTQEAAPKGLKPLKPLGKKTSDPESEEVEEEVEEAAPAKKTLSTTTRALKPLGKKPAPEPEEAEEVEEVEEAPAPKRGLKPLGKKPTPEPEPEEVEEEVEVEAEVVEETAKPTARGLKRLGAKPQPEPEEEAEEPERSIVVAQPAAYELGRVTGDIEDSDLSRPRLEFVQSVGPLVEEHEYTPGQVVLNKEVLVWEKGYPALEVIVLAANKRFVEVTEYGSDVMPRIFRSKDEVKAAGLWTEWQDNEAPPVKPELAMLVLVKQPDYIEPHDMFNVAIGDELWALTECRLGGTAFKNPKAGRYIMTIEKTTLSKGLHRGVMSLTTVREKPAKNTITVPVFKYLRASTDEQVRAIEELMGA